MNILAVVNQILKQPEGSEPQGREPGQNGDESSLLGLPASLIGIPLLSLEEQLSARRNELSEALGREPHDAVTLLDLIATEDSASFAGQIDDYALLTKQALQDLLHAAAYDKLTGLFSRNLLEIRLREEFRRARRYQLPLSVLFIDVDDFKRINDSFGHSEGDHVLSFIGRFILDRLREVDFPVRYGGEEFVVILPHTDGETALQLASRIHDGIEQAQREAGLRGTVTLSIGVGTLADCMETEDQLLDASDRSVYKAKEQKDMVWPYVNAGVEPAPQVPS